MAGKNGDDSMWSQGKDILTILVIPMFLWGVCTEIRMTKVERQDQLEQDIRALQRIASDLNDTADFNSAEANDIKKITTP